MAHWIDLPAAQRIANLRRKIEDVEHTNMHMAEGTSNDVSFIKT